LAKKKVNPKARKLVAEKTKTPRDRLQISTSAGDNPSWYARVIARKRNLGKPKSEHVTADQVMSEGKAAGDGDGKSWAAKMFDNEKVGIRCPKCHCRMSQIIKTTPQPALIKRRRECRACEHRWTTRETI